MKKLLSILFVFISLTSNAQAPDTTTTYKKVVWKINQLKDNTIRALTPLNFRNAFNSLKDMSAARVPNLTLSEVKAGEADNSTAFHFIAGKQSGLYVYDASDVTSAEDTALVIRSGTRRYKRQIVNGEYYPEFWNAAANGTTNDYSKIQRALDAAYANDGVTIFDRTYLTNSALLIRSDIKGSGTIKTSGTATVTVGRSSVFIKEITIDGGSSGRGLYMDGVNDVTIENVTIKNVVNQAFWSRRARRIKISGCTVNGVSGSYGDAYYFTECTSPSVIGSYGANFTRIGIVFEGADSTTVAPTNLYTTDAIAIGNLIENAIENADPVNFPNGGIWGENCGGAIISGNIVRNIPARGIVLSPSISDLETYQYNISNNNVYNVWDSGTYTGTGVSMSFADNQTLNITNNIITDCRRGMEFSRFFAANITGNTFNAKNRPASWFNTNMLFIMVANQAWTSRVKITASVNNVPDYAGRLPVVITNNSTQNMDMNMSDCIGNHGFVMNTSTVTGNLSVSNCLLDLSGWTAANYNLANITGSYKIDNCEMRLPDGVNLGLVAGSVSISNSTMKSINYCKLFLGASGAPLIRFFNVQLDRVWFFDIRRANTSITLIDCSFGVYSSTSGVFENTVTELAYLQVTGCSFSKTTTSTPIAITSGVTESLIGNNDYYTTLLYSGFTPTYQPRSFARGATANRPASPQTGYEYFDTTLSRMIYWNGSEWLVLGGASTGVSGTSTTVPTKTQLNTAYGTLRAGSIYYKPLVTGGGRDYQKIDDTATSDWLETIWATGVKSIVP